MQKQSAQSPSRFALVDLNYKVTQTIASQPPAILEGLTQASSEAPNDLIAPGDALAISVFEAGSAGLFARPAELAGGNTPSTFPRLVVDSRGILSIPFAGDITVAGQTPKAASETIRHALIGRAIDPQVTVTLVESAANSVSVIGEIAKSGRYPISANNDRLLDVIAAAGGPTRQPADTEVVIVRGMQSAETPLSEVLRDPAENIRLAPHDQVRLLSNPRRYSTFGALAHNAQVPMEDVSVTLAAAISRAGGLDPTTADGESVLVFRFESPAVAKALGLSQAPTPKGVPVLYRLNLRSADGYFIANTFEIEPDDLLYVPRSRLTESQQFLTYVGVISQIAYNARVASVIQ